MGSSAPNRRGHQDVELTHAGKSSRAIPMLGLEGCIDVVGRLLSKDHSPVVHTKRLLLLLLLLVMLLQSHVASDEFH